MSLHQNILKQYIIYAQNLQRNVGTTKESIAIFSFAVLSFGLTFKPLFNTLLERMNDNSLSTYINVSTNFMLITVLWNAL